MSGKIEISRELAERLLNFTCNEEYDELRALLAAPVVERQPVAYRYKESHAPWENENPWGVTSLAHGAVLLERKALAASGTFKGNSQAYYLTLKVDPLYASPPAPVSVVLPERKGANLRYDSLMPTFSMGWNACLDKVKELNQ